jgi:hypothetical protein
MCPSFFRKSIWVLVALATTWLSGGNASAIATGVPASFTLDPATARQRDKDVSQVVATVTLESPAPTFFVCELRSADSRKVSFSSIIFRKGDTTEQGQGVVHWKFILKDARVRITAYSTDAPDRQLSFTLALKPKLAEETDTTEPQ